MHGEEGLRAGLETQLSGDKDTSNKIRRGQPAVETKRRRVKEEPEDKKAKPSKRVKTEKTGASTPTPTKAVAALADISDLSEDEEDETASNTALASMTAELDALLTQLTAMAAIAKRACREYKATIDMVKDVSLAKAMKDTYRALSSDFRAVKAGNVSGEKVKEVE